jgi:hypothetical protein
MWPIDTAGSANNPEQLTGDYVVANLNYKFFLMIESAINAFTMIDDCGVPADD